MLNSKEVAWNYRNITLIYICKVKKKSHSLMYWSGTFTTQSYIWKVKNWPILVLYNRIPYVRFQSFFFFFYCGKRRLITKQLQTKTKALCIKESNIKRFVQNWRIHHWHSIWGRRGRDRNCSWIYNYLCNHCISLLMLWVRISLRRDVLDTALW
jgi:hypothetical protein